MIQTKTLIIGAGPAGCSCGIRSQQNGIDSIVVERASLPRVKLCAGLLTAKSLTCLKTLLRNDLSRLLEEIPVSHSKGFTLLNNYQEMLSCNMSEAITMVERPLFDNWLAQYYRSLGGNLMEGVALSELDLNSNTATLSDGQTIQFDCLVAADGANSTVGHILSKKFPKAFPHKNNNGLCIELNIDRQDIDIDDDVKLYFGVVDKSYAWSFTKGNKVCLGLVKLPGSDFDAKERMLEFCKKLGVRNLEKYPVRGAMLPLGDCRRRRSYKNVLFAGDAAGLVEPPTGEGIYYALQSGMWAADSVASKDPSAKYEKDSRILTRMIEKNAFYQKLLEIKLTNKLFFKHVGKHPDFVRYFYETQIDNFTLDSLPVICKKYIDLKKKL